VKVSQNEILSWFLLICIELGETKSSQMGEVDKTEINSNLHVDLHTLLQFFYMSLLQTQAFFAIHC
jgi:hypothetical protein